ncbi:MAG: hypothetical protein IJ155_03270 [Prevotella sp.]|nr:hypothetical protein [Prevotella sp.]
MNIVGTFVNNGEYREVHDVQQVTIASSTVSSASEQKPLGQTPVFLNAAKGMKIDFIRVMNALYEPGFFQTAQGGRLTKKEFFTTIGQAVNIDLSNYDKDLSRSTADSTALEKHLRVFDDMRRKMTETFNSK